MKPLIVSANDLGGGAGIAAFRLHQALLKRGLPSDMFVQRNMSGSPSIQAATSRSSKVWSLLQPHLDRAPVKWFGSPKDLFHPQWVPAICQRNLSTFHSDIVNLHWICDGFQQIEAVGRIDRPIVWTLHDMWPMTGGCHYAGSCEAYTSHCGRCPTLGSQRDIDLSRWVWKRKQRAWQQKDLVIVTPSRWLAECAARSSLFSGRRIVVIPNGIDLSVFKPIDKRLARQILNLPQDIPLILFGAMSGSTRKGAHHLKAALPFLANRGLGAALVTFGNPQQHHEFSGFKTHYLGRLSDEIALSLSYAAADVFVAPSEQDNLPNTMIEAFASGTPCVAFKIGGMPDIIDEGINGHLARPFEPQDLARCISDVLQDPQRRAAYSVNARLKAQKSFAVELMAERYAGLFSELVGAKGKEAARQMHEHRHDIA